MSKKYGRQQLAQFSKPSVPPPSGFTEYFADIDNNGKLTIFYPNGETLVIEDFIERIGNDAYYFSGFINRSANLSFDNETRTLSISGDFTFYNRGKKVTKNGDSCVIGTQKGVYYCFYNTNNILVSSLTMPPYSLPWVAIVIWDQEKSIICDYRYHPFLDPNLRENEFLTNNAKFLFGLDGTFNTNNFAIDSGGIVVADLDYLINEQNSCDIFYKNGSSPYVWYENQTKFYLDNGTFVYYNNGNTLSLVESNKYVAYWVCATTAKIRPIISIVGQRKDDTLIDAKLNNKFTSLDLSYLPFHNLIVLYRVILKGDKTVSDVLDLRGSNLNLNFDYKPFSHFILSDNDTFGVHNLSSIINTPSGNVSSTNAQDAINELDLKKINKSGDTFTGPINLYRDPVNDLEPISKRYIPELRYKKLERLNKDDYGIFTLIKYYDSNNVLKKTSELSGGTPPLYTTRTEKYYDAQGNLLQTLTYTLTYDNNEDIISEEL